MCVSPTIIFVMRYKIGAVTLTLVLVASVLGASAFTSGSVERTSNVNVVNDDTGLLALEDGTSGGLVFQNSSGALEIDFTKGGAGGANVESHYELGNPSDPTNQTAFNITNNDDESHDIKVSYTGAGGTADTDDNIKFQVYDSNGDLQGTVSEESTSQTFTAVSSGSTLYVVMVVDTYGLDNSSDLSGTLKVSA
jgi:hypothetical protein